jgi:16S rRNA A1518/A1519 N6-dimethyltransferase RsmA/KsgA/DIM1 with predicted DNA glycosylase/AP lyase activity
MNIALIIFGLAILPFFLLVIWYLLSSFYFIYLGTPTVSTSKRITRAILKKIDLSGRKKFYDLGSGNGWLISRIARRHPELRCIGIEYNIAAHCCARVRNIFAKHKIDYRWENFFEAHLEDADVVYIYLPPHITDNLETKFARELKKGAIVVSNTFTLKSKKPSKIIDGTVYVYEY